MVRNEKHNILINSHQLLMRERDCNYTLDRLASDLKRSKKTLYKFFRSKNQLITEVFKEHLEYINRLFEEIEHSDISEIDKLIKYIYLVDESLREIRLSRWYEQAKKHTGIKDNYFELRVDCYEHYLNKGLTPFEPQLEYYGQTKPLLSSFLVSSLEANYFRSTLQEITERKPLEYVEKLIFLLHGCLISLKND
ncbi:TetR/AcrR family transcriptional regulator [Winogradskyella forsetii]|uniref:TetR/AcrR family transcriptional regulator n=1 Tax=Winogradskyella forsetii TaxID=2686077 RepID=UPI0015CD2BAA|nr:TetR/AcrR family transcriptional regulator [Winogradskyella forsetii]